MKKVLSCLAILALFVASAYAKNSNRGYEGKEIGLSIKEAINTETYIALSYGLNNKFEIGLGYGVDSKDKNLNSIGSEINFHFRPKKKFDPYLGTGLSYCKEILTSYSPSDTLYKDPITFYNDRWKGLLIIGINYWFIKNIALGLESYNRISNGHVSNRPFLGIKFAF